MLLLTRACEDLERERQEREEEKERYLGEQLPPLKVSGLSLEELQVLGRQSGEEPRQVVKPEALTTSSFLSDTPQTLCKQLHAKIDVVDEERYDCESKVNKHNKDVSYPAAPLFEKKGGK